MNIYEKKKIEQYNESMEFLGKPEAIIYVHKIHPYDFHDLLKNSSVGSVGLGNLELLDGKVYLQTAAIPVSPNASLK